MGGNLDGTAAAMAASEAIPLLNAAAPVAKAAATVADVLPDGAPPYLPRSTRADEVFIRRNRHRTSPAFILQLSPAALAAQKAAATDNAAVTGKPETEKTEAEKTAKAQGTKKDDAVRDPQKAAKLTEKTAEEIRKEPEKAEKAQGHSLIGGVLLGAATGLATVAGAVGTGLYTAFSFSKDAIMNTLSKMGFGAMQKYPAVVQKVTSKISGGIG